jgi:hypothetical protein
VNPKNRRHHNNYGRRQIKNGKTTRQVICMCARIFGRKNIKVMGNTIKIKMGE